MYNVTPEFKVNPEDRENTKFIPGSRVPRDRLTIIQMGPKL
jgi:hypothetical protein